jgi:hypothetical protein
MPGPSQCISRDPVFCSECHWLDCDSIHRETAKCTHPNNRNKKNDNWYERDQHGYRSPWKINKKNKCHWYEVKGSRMSGGGKKLL